MKPRPAFHVYNKLKESARIVAEIFEREEKEIREAYLNEAIDTYIDNKQKQ